MPNLATRTRTCPACAAPVSDRRARWCGSCGELLGAPAEPAASTPAAVRPWVRRSLVVAAIALGVGLLAVAGDGLVDRVGPTSTGVQDLAVGTPDEDTLADVRRRVPPPPPPPPPVERPTCTGVPADTCFAWLIEAPGASFEAVIPTAEFIVTAGSMSGPLAVHGLDDGELRWSVQPPPSDQSGVTVGTELGLVVHTSGERLVAREIATGEERWSTDELGQVVPYQAWGSGDTVVVSAGRPGASRNDGSFEMVLAGFDPATGAVRWRHGAADITPLEDGDALLTDFDGSARVVTAAGTVRWQRDDLVDRTLGGGAWGYGHVITIMTADRSQLLLASTGEPLGFDGTASATDDQHTFVEVYADVEQATSGEQHDDSVYVQGDEVALVGPDGVLWRVPAEGWSGCVNQVVLEDPDVITIEPCDGGTVVLDRADGQLIGREPATIGATNDGWFAAGPYGPYVIGHDDPATPDPAMVVTDTRTDEEVARLPPDTWPAWSTDAPREGIFGNRFILHGQRWLVALPVPDLPGDGPTQ